MTSDKVGEQFSTRILEELTTYFGINALSIGCDLNLFSHIAEKGEEGITPEELAGKSGCNLRCIVEWLECCATNNYINLKENGRFYILPGHATVLLNNKSPIYQRAWLKFIPGVSACYESLVDGFKTGNGVPYEDYGMDCVRSIRENDETLYENNLSQVIMPAFPELHEKFMKEGGTVCDVGCGSGPLSILIARLYDKVNVVGVDIDERSIEEAEISLSKENQSVQKRVRFLTKPFEEIDEKVQSFDMIVFFLALHDIPDPAKSLTIAKKFVKPNTGRVAILEVNVQDNIHDMCIKPGMRPPSVEENPNSVFGRLAYGFSIVHCLHCTMSQPHEHAAGTAFSKRRIAVQAEKAGFKNVEYACNVQGAFNVYKVY